MPVPEPTGCPKSVIGRHCDHFTGTGTSHGHGGSDDVQCCYCGRVKARRWEIRSEQILGHGPHAREKIKVYVK
jgi:hypothetical protein